MKTLPTGNDNQDVNADRLHKFRREFRTLSEVNHPNLVGMQTLEFDGSQWFFHHGPGERHRLPHLRQAQ